jgi:hypothetical protein
LPDDTEYKPPIPVSSGPAATVNRNTQSLLPQPVEDDAITKELSKIRDNIKNHVQTYYHFQLLPGEVASSELAAFATATGLEATAIAAMLANTSMRGDIMRLFIAWAILSRCEEGQHPTLLPPELAFLLQTMSRRDHRDRGKCFSIPILRYDS